MSETTNDLQTEIIGFLGYVILSNIQVATIELENFFFRKIISAIKKYSTAFNIYMKTKKVLITRNYIIKMYLTMSKC
jgi:hypothetical protein